MPAPSLRGQAAAPWLMPLVFLLGPAGCGGGSSAGAPARDLGRGAPADLGTTPADLGTTPADLGTTPADLGTTPADSGAASDVGGEDDGGRLELADLAPDRADLAAPGGDGPGDGGPPLLDVAYLAGCEPAGGPVCTLPFPSDLFTRPDPGAATGLRLAYAPGQLPATAAGRVFDPTRWNLADGHSPGGALITTFPVAVDPATLPDPQRLEATLADDSPVLLVDVDPASDERGQRIPLLVEVMEDGRTLRLQPLRVLRPATRYVAGLRGTVRALEGRALPASSAFAALRDGQLTRSAPLEALRARFDRLFAELEAVHPVRRAQLTQAWSFTTRSTGDSTRYLLRMRDEGLRRVGEEGAQVLGLAVDTTDPEDPDSEPGIGGPTDDWLIKLTGLLRVPSFLEPDGTVRLGDDGLPEFVAWEQVRFHLILPAERRGTVAPLPMVLYGHGLFSEPWEPYWGSQARLRQRLGRAFVGLRWRGLSGAADGVALLPVLQNLSTLPRLVDRLMQGTVDFLVMQEAILSGALAGAVATLLQQQGITDYPSLSPLAEDLGYIGISLGGTQGFSLAALSPRLSRVVVGVPGACWSAMIPRSSQWRGEDFLVPLEQVVRTAYPATPQRWLLFSLLQTVFDQMDAVGLVRHVARDWLPYPTEGGEPPTGHQILVQEGVGDAQVSNLTTELVARSAAIPLIGSSFRSPWGIEVQHGEIAGGSALAIYRLAAPEGQDAGQWQHANLRKVPAALDQIAEFLETGVIRNHCPEGNCDGLTF